MYLKFKKKYLLNWCDGRITDLSANESDFFQEIYRNWNKRTTNELEKGKTKFPTAALLKVQIFWEMTLCCCVSSWWHFKELPCLQLQDQAFTAGSWSWRLYNDSECWELWRNISVGLLLDPGDEGTTILQNYLPTDTALYSRISETSTKKKGGGGEF